jgi:mono/diheme cytochrome c family protein
MRSLATASAVLVLNAAVAAMPAQAAGDAEAGHALARQWCASCHVVDRSGGNGADTAPPFPEIARRSQQDRNWVRAWLVAPHPPMPNLTLSRQEIDDVVAYLDNLAQR